MAGIKVDGIDKLMKKLKDNVTMDDVKRVVRHNGAQLQDKMQTKADFNKGYQTGTTKRSIFLEIEDSGLTAAVGPGETPLNPNTGFPATEYAPYVNYGTRFQDAQPFVTNAHNEQKEKFKRDMDKLVK